MCSWQLGVKVQTQRCVKMYMEVLVCEEGKRIQDIGGHFLCFHVFSVEYWLEGLNVHVAELIVPEVVYCRGHQGEVVVLETMVTVVNGNRESTENPPIHHCLLPRKLRERGEGGREGGRGKEGGGRREGEGGRGKEGGGNKPRLRVCPSRTHLI